MLQIEGYGSTSVTKLIVPSMLVLSAHAHNKYYELVEVVNIASGIMFGC